MKAVVLAGGYATRLRPISYAIPKLLFPVLGKPMIYWTLDLLKDFGVEEVVLGVNYLADLLSAELGERYRGIHIIYSLEDRPLGTGGPIRLAAEKLRLADTFIAMNGDIIADLDLNKMLKQHRRTRAAITDALHEVDDPRRFGVVKLDPESRIRTFVEKPTAGQEPSRLVNAGIYLIEPNVLKMISPRKKVSLEREIFPKLARRRKLGGFPFFGDWFDIGDLSDYRKANFALLRQHSQEAALSTMTRSLAERTIIRQPVFSRGNSRIEAGASVGPYVIMGERCNIRRRARLSQSILFDGVTVGERATISGAIVASNVTIGNEAKIGSGSIVSPGVQIKDGRRIGNKVIIHPHKEIDRNISSGAHVM